MQDSSSHLAHAQGVAALTAVALFGFAANSLLCRAALSYGFVDPVSFTTIRLVSGALTMAALVRRRGQPAPGRHGSIASAAALFAYALLFSVAYVRIFAGVGAFLLFGSVQVTMIGWGVLRGERPHLTQWAGLVIALSGLGFLTLPGARAPDLGGAISMVGAGIAWGVYSLRGRGKKDPVAATAENFFWAGLFAAACSAIASLTNGWSVSGPGLGLSVASGAITSALIYTLWYSLLRHLTATTAALVQLSVPVIASAGSIALLGEPLSARLVLSGAVVLAGVVLATVPRRAQRVTAAPPGSTEP